MFTRKHLEAIACTIRRLDLDDEDKRKVAKTFADDLALAVRNFDREKFYQACGI